MVKINYAAPDAIKPKKVIPKKIKQGLIFTIVLGLLIWILCLTLPVSGFGSFSAGHTFYILKPWVIHLTLNLGFLAALMFLLSGLELLIYRRWVWGIVWMFPALLVASTSVGKSVNGYYFPTRVLDELDGGNGKIYCSMQANRSVNQYALSIRKNGGKIWDSYEILDVVQMPANLPASTHIQTTMREGEIVLIENVIHVVFRQYCIMQYDIETQTFTGKPE